ncbi:MAG TPA: hypothetical protein VNU71_15205 [Burkholderiaceae bacterium]|nr:hypothetical protein [Burkholderiaceae bacterium]
MTATPTPIDLHTGLPHTGLTAHELVGFELGWDHARHRVELPAPYGDEPSPLRDGLLAGRATFGTRTLAATRAVRKWLQLRLNAWLRGRSVELVQVTPHYLQQIDATHCPITRVALTAATRQPSDASIDRVRNDAGYAAGNLAVMSVRANHAKAALGSREAALIAAALDAEAAAGPRASAAPGPRRDGLSAAEWSRVALLCSFVEPLSHAEASALPMHVLPPNRLRLFNPVQALQAFLSRQWLRPGWSRRIAGVEALLPEALRRDFRAFHLTLAARVLAAGPAADEAQARWAVEDAWSAPRVQQRWARFAGRLDAAACETLLARAAALGLATTVVMPLTDAGATDGWNLATRGYLPPAANAVPAGRQQHLAW